jgi:ElaB/YqjD/DUF883 family membrane-anchored ribosome-binding protein
VEQSGAAIVRAQTTEAARMSSRMEGSQPQTVDEARDAVVRSRQRISSTLDQLEDRIVEKKHELQEKADVLGPVRERVVARPFTAVAVAVGVGALLGSLGGGHDDSGRSSSSRSRRAHRDSVPGDDERAELRKWRRARQQRLRARSHSAREDAGHDGHEDGSSRLDGLRHQLMGAVTTAIGAAITAKVRDMTSGSADGNGRRYRAG